MQIKKGLASHPRPLKNLSFFQSDKIDSSKKADSHSNIECESAFFEGIA